MVGNADGEAVVRDVEGYRPFIYGPVGKALLLNLHGKLITELIFTKQRDLRSDQVTQAGHGLDGKILGCISCVIHYLKARP